MLKADVSGSLEALQDEIAKLPQERDRRSNVIHAATGGINESDVMLAAASDAIIIGFNVRPLADARRAAEREGVEIRTYSVIYKVTEDLRRRAGGPARARGGRGGARPGRGQGAVQGLARRHDRRLRGHRRQDHPRRPRCAWSARAPIVWTGRIGSLRRFKDNVQEVEEGLECGVVLEGYQDVKVGDVLELFETKQVEQTLE